MNISYLLKAADPYAVGQAVGSAFVYIVGVVVIISVTVFLIIRAISKSRNKK
jgi:hypothetical protein